MDTSKHFAQLPDAVTQRLTRRGLLATAGGLTAAGALAACGSSASAGSSGSASDAATGSASGTAPASPATSSPSVSSTGIGATSAAGTTAAAASNTHLSAGSYKATFSTTGSGGMGNAAGGGASGSGQGAPAAPPGGTSGSGAGGAAPGGSAPGAAGGAKPSGTAPGGTAPGGAPGGGSSGGTQTLKGAYLVNGIHATIEGGTWRSSTADQNVFLVVNGGSLTIKDATIIKSGNTASQDGSNFYGLNAAVLVVGAKSSVTMTNCRVTTASEGSNALFATNGGRLSAANVTIRTSKNSSRGLDATYTGVITASGMDIATSGAHCACLATDRGNGTVTVTGTNKLATTGDGSPLVYSTGNISVSGATGLSTGAQTMVIEGKNSITVSGCTFRTSGTEGMMIYQSFSGDAADASATASHSTMTITDSTIISATSKPMIYMTNTTCVVNATSTKFTHPRGSKLLDLEADRWGTSGSNGGHATVTFATCGALTGNLTAGSTSSATVKLTGGTTSSGSTSGSVTVSKG